MIHRLLPTLRNNFFYLSNIANIQIALKKTHQRRKSIIQPSDDLLRRAKEPSSRKNKRIDHIRNNMHNPILRNDCIRCHDKSILNEHQWREYRRRYSAPVLNDSRHRNVQTGECEDLGGSIIKVDEKMFSVIGLKQELRNDA